MRTIRWIVLGAVAALFVNVGPVAAAPPPASAPAEKLCHRQNGSLGFNSEQDFYSCSPDDSSNPNAFTASQLRAAQRLCESRYAGTFDPPTSGVPEYYCRNVTSI